MTNTFDSTFWHIQSLDMQHFFYILLKVFSEFCDNFFIHDLFMHAIINGEKRFFWYCRLIHVFIDT